MVANWLYGVASLTARKTRAVALRRKVHEKQVEQMPEAVAMDEQSWEGIRTVLDQGWVKSPIGTVPPSFFAIWKVSLGMKRRDNSACPKELCPAG